jgi:hypothetical protein
MNCNLGTLLAFSQGGYYITTGIWAVLHRRSFEWLTGPKDEFWLVRTAGLLIGLLGAVLTLAGIRRRTMEPEVGLLAAGTAASLVSIDVIYWKRGRLWPIYLLDAAGEAALIVGWLAVWLSKRQAQ